MPKQRGGKTICWIPLEGLVVSSKGFNAKEVFLKKTLQKNKRKLKIFFYPSSSH
jgi:hypothetical protein